MVHLKGVSLKWQSFLSPHCQPWGNGCLRRQLYIFSVQVKFTKTAFKVTLLTKALIRHAALHTVRAHITPASVLCVGNECSLGCCTCSLPGTVLLATWGRHAAWKRSAPDLDLEVFWSVGGDIGLVCYVTSGFAGSHPSVFLCGFLSSPSVWSQPLSTRLWRTKGKKPNSARNCRSCSLSPLSQLCAWRHPVAVSRDGLCRPMEPRCQLSTAWECREFQQ